jgi:hypothetical protein
MSLDAPLSSSGGSGVLEGTLYWNLGWFGQLSRSVVLRYLVAVGGIRPLSLHAEGSDLESN